MFSTSTSYPLNSSPISNQNETNTEPKENTTELPLPKSPEKVIVWTPQRKEDGTVKFIPSPVKQQLKGIKENCIYQFKNEKEEKKYIGSSVKTNNTDIVRRLQKYGRTINKEQTSDKTLKQRSFRPIEKALRKSPTDFTCSVLKVYPGTCEEELKVAEEKWIKEWKTHSPTKGYNKRMPTTEPSRTGVRAVKRSLLFIEAEKENEEVKSEDKV